MQHASAPTIDAADKRTNVLEQAIHAFAKEGFRSTDVQLIADGAGVGKGTVYRYFGSKENLFWSATLEVLRRLGAHLATAAEGQPSAVAKLRALAQGYAEFFDTTPDYLELFVQNRAEFRGVGPESHSQYHAELNQKFGQYISEGIERGELRPVDPYDTVNALGAVLYGSVVMGCYRVGDRPLRGVVQQAFEIFLRGLMAPTPSANPEGALEVES